MSVGLSGLLSLDGGLGNRWLGSHGGDPGTGADSAIPSGPHGEVPRARADHAARRSAMDLGGLAAGAAATTAEGAAVTAAGATGAAEGAKDGAAAAGKAKAAKGSALSQQLVGSLCFFINCMGTSMYVIFSATHAVACMHASLSLIHISEPTRPY